MKKELLYGASGLLIGVAIAGSAAVVINNRTGTMGTHTSNMSDTMMDMTMNQMTASLQSKAGEDFDQNFTSMMIAHHQSGIDMARLAQQNAMHDEVKKLADDIVSVQSKEIAMMQSWQSKWGQKLAPKPHDMHTMH